MPWIFASLDELTRPKGYSRKGAEAHRKTPEQDNAYSRSIYFAAWITEFRTDPSFSIRTSNTSPALSVTGGSRKNPTPSGVPVAITSPGSSVIPCEMYEIKYATLK